jgi:hypothetical protein
VARSRCLSGKQEAITVTTIDVSAQFGGRDAAKAVLPHFWALKSALKGAMLVGFPFRELAFILRVDGDVNTYGQSGAGNVQFDKKGAYVSVDLGLTHEDLAGRGPAEVATFVAGAIMSSVPLLRGLGDARLEAVDWGALETGLQAFSAAYKAQVGAGAARQE